MKSCTQQQTGVIGCHVEPCFMVDDSRLRKGCGQLILDEILEWFDELENDIDHELTCVDHHLCNTVSHLAYSSHSTVLPSGVNHIGRHLCSSDDAITGSLCRQCQLQTLVETTSGDDDESRRSYFVSGRRLPEDDVDIADRRASQSLVRSLSAERSIQVTRQRDRFECRRKMVTTTLQTSHLARDTQQKNGQIDYFRSATMNQPTNRVTRQPVGGSAWNENGAVIGVIDRVTLTQQVWNLGAVSRAAAIHVLQNRPDGAFVVRAASGTDRDRNRSLIGANQLTLPTPSSSSDQLLHVRQGNRVVQFAIVMTSHGRWHLLDSRRTFASLAELIAHYCQQRLSGLQLTLPDEISAAKTLDELRDIAEKQAEFWVSILSKSSTLPLRSATRPSTIQTQRSFPEQANNTAATQASVRREEVYPRRRRDVKHCGSGNVDSRRPHKQQRLIQRDDEDDAINGGKASDYEDLWPASTPVRSTTPTDNVAFDPTKYQLQSKEHQPTIPKSKPIGPSGGADRFAEVLGTRCNRDADPNRKFADVEQTSAFDFDASSLKRRAMDNRRMWLDLPTSVPTSNGPSPVYAEPWDSLATGPDTHRRVLSTAVSGTADSSSRTIAVTKERLIVCGSPEDSEEEVGSAGYRAPLDAVLAPAALRPKLPGYAGISRPSIPMMPPPPAVPPPPPVRDRVPEVVVTPFDDDDASNRCRTTRVGDSTDIVDKELSELLIALGSSLENSSTTLQFHGTVNGSGKNVPRKPTRTPDRNRGDKSDYDNMSEDDVNYEEDDDVNGLMPPVPRDRLLTGSSVRTQYSPPWDGTRWQQLMYAVGDDNNNEYCDVEDEHRKMSHLCQQHSTCSATRSIDMNSTETVRLVADNISTQTEMTSTVTRSNFDRQHANSNMMYCDSSLQRDVVASLVANGNDRIPFLRSGIVPADSPAAHSTPIRRVSAVSRTGGGVSGSHESFAINGVMGSLQKTAAAAAAAGSDATLFRRMQSKTGSREVEWMAADSAHSSYQSLSRLLSRLPRHPVSRQASGASRNTTVATSSTLTRALPASSSVCSTMSRIGVSGWTPQKSPDVIPLTALPRLISPRYRGHRFPAAQISDFIVRLTARKPESQLGTLVQNFIQCTLNGKEMNPRKVISNIRQFMNGMKNFLSFNGEPELDKFINSIRSEMKPSECLNLDAVLEMALIKCTVKPLKEYVYRLFEYDYTRNGNLQMLNEGLKAARSSTPSRLGVRPDFISSMDEVSKYLKLMEESYSPLAKLENLLSAMTTIGGCITAHHDEISSSMLPSQVSADDLLSTAASVLVERNMLSAEIEADYMWGLIHPSFLVGEASYQLTTFSCAVNQLKNFKKLAESRTSLYRVGSIDATVGSSGGSVDGHITVMTVDERCDTVVRHSLPVRPEVAAKDICCMLAHRLRITNPQDYGLFSVSSGLDKRLADDDRIQPILPPSSNCTTFDRRKFKFLYKRIDARFVWPQNLIND